MLQLSGSQTGPRAGQQQMGPKYKEKDYTKQFGQPVCTENCTKPHRHVAFEPQVLCISYSTAHVRITMCWWEQRNSKQLFPPYPSSLHHRGTYFAYTKGGYSMQLRTRTVVVHQDKMLWRCITSAWCWRGCSFLRRVGIPRGRLHCSRKRPQVHVAGACSRRAKLRQKHQMLLESGGCFLNPQNLE